MSAVTLDTRDRIFAGILLTGLSYFLFTVHDAIVKLLVMAIPVWQVLFFRSLTILIGCLIFGGRQIYKEAWHTPIFRPMFLRSFLILAAWLCFYTAARDLQLAELTTIYYAAPIIVTVLSVLVLDEKVPFTRWAAVTIGFIGVFVACDRPGSVSRCRSSLCWLPLVFGAFRSCFCARSRCRRRPSCR